MGGLTLAMVERYDHPPPQMSDETAAKLDALRSSQRFRRCSLLVGVSERH